MITITHTSLDVAYLSISMLRGSDPGYTIERIMHVTDGTKSYMWSEYWSVVMSRILWMSVSFKQIFLMCHGN